MTPLPHESLLTVMGEVAAAFVGFSLVVSALRARSNDSLDETRRFYSMREVAEIGLVCVFASFLPLVIHAFGASPDAIWRIGSATFLALVVLSGSGSFWRRGGLLVTIRSEPIIAAIILPTLFVLYGLLLVNLFAGGPGSGARYVAALLLSLVVSGVIFVNATFNTARDRPDA